MPLIIFTSRPLAVDHRGSEVVHDAAGIGALAHDRHAEARGERLDVGLIAGQKLQIAGSAPTFFACVASTGGVSYDGSKLIDSSCTRPRSAHRP